MLITFEGIDGSGKTTQVRLLEKRLRETGYRSRTVREPGGTRLSERVRELLLAPDLAVTPFAEMLLFSAARTQLVSQVIRPALEAGDIVLCDRFFDSTTAYQGSGRGLGELVWMLDFHRRVTGGVTPTRTYWIDVPLQVARARQARREGEVEGGGRPDRMEQADAAFYERVAAGYAAIAEAEPGRVLRLDGALSAEVLRDQIWEDLEELLRMRKRGDGVPLPGQKGTEPPR